MWAIALLCLVRGTAAAIPIVIDTDMSIDVDDVGMLCAAHALQDLDEAKILAVVHDCGADAGVGAVSVINRFYGRDDIPIGAYRGPLGNSSGFFPGEVGWTQRGRGVYIDDLVAAFPSTVRRAADVPEATVVFRQALAEAADRSVTIVSVGFATNLLSLLQSPADGFSGLAGVELVRAKVSRLVFMGGRQNLKAGEPVEWNFGGWHLPRQHPAGGGDSLTSLAP